MDERRRERRFRQTKKEIWGLCCHHFLADGSPALFSASLFSASLGKRERGPHQSVWEAQESFPLLLLLRTKNRTGGEEGSKEKQKKFLPPSSSLNGLCSAKTGRRKRRKKRRRRPTVGRSRTEMIGNGQGRASESGSGPFPPSFLQRMPAVFLCWSPPPP